MSPFSAASPGPVCAHSALMGGRKLKHATISVWNAKHAAGLSLRVVPHDPRKGSLRANVHYFEHGDAWWYTGGADLIRRHATGGFLTEWAYITKEWRDDISYRTAYLRACANEGWIEENGAFKCITEVMDELRVNCTSVMGRRRRRRDIKIHEDCRFIIRGGGICAIRMVTKGDMKSFQFEISPSPFTKAGRQYNSLRTHIQANHESQPLFRS